MNIKNRIVKLEKAVSILTLKDEEYAFALDRPKGERWTRNGKEYKGDVPTAKSDTYKIIKRTTEEVCNEEK